MMIVWLRLASGALDLSVFGGYPAVAQVNNDCAEIDALNIFIHRIDPTAKAFGGIAMPSTSPVRALDR